MKIFVKSLVCLLTFCVSVGGLAEPKSTGDWARRDAFVNPEKIGESIKSSWEGGVWRHEGISGSFRFLLTEYKSDRDKLYIQWVRENGEVAYSMSVKELNIRPEYALTMPTCTNESSCRLIMVSGTHYYEKNTRKFKIHLNGLGKYQFSF